MKYKKNILLFLFFAFCITDCKKYPEGPAISFRFKNSRITGAYIVESYKVNGVDSISTLNCIDYYAFANKGELGGCCLGRWELINKKKNILIDVDNYDEGPFITKKELVWKILRLTNENFWMEINYQNNDYELKLKKTHDYIP